MKKPYIIALACLLCLFLAQEIDASYFVFSEEGERKDTDPYSDFSAHLPDELRTTFDDIVSPDDPTSQKAWTSVARSAVTTLVEQLTPAFARLSLLLGVLILTALWHNLYDPLTSQGCMAASSLLVRSVLTVTLLSSQMKIIDMLEEFSRIVCQTTALFVPAMTSLLVSSGNCTTALLTESGFAFAISLAENLFSYVVLPAVKASFALSSVAILTKQSAPASIAAFLRNTAGGVCTLAMTLFSYVYSLRVKGGLAADTALMKTVRFAVGAFVPIVGGPVSESVDQMTASLGIIKNVCGSAAAALIIVFTLPALIGLALNRISLFITKHVCEILSLGDETKLFSEFGSASTLSLAYAVSVTVAFVNCMAVFVRSAASF